MASISTKPLLPVVSGPATNDDAGLVWGDEDLSSLIAKGYLEDKGAFSEAEIQKARRRYLIAGGKIDVDQERDERIDRIARDVGEVTGYIAGGAAAGALAGAASAAVVGASVAMGAAVGAITVPVVAAVGLAALLGYMKR